MTDTREANRQRSRIARRYIPPQHGAWAFLGLPLILGALLAPATALLIVLGIAWIGAYPLSYAVLGLVRSHRPKRFQRPAVLWSLIVIPSSIVLVMARPWLVWVGVLYLVLFAVNMGYARRGDERALANDLVFIVECSMMVPVTWAVGASASAVSAGALPVPVHVWVLTAVCGLVLIGSTLHVKSLIRERSNPAFARASKTFAAICVPISFALAAVWGLPSGLWLVVPFLALAFRSLRPVATNQRPGMIGLIELGCFVLVIAAAALTVS